jgi:hypothetical protein
MEKVKIDQPVANGRGRGKPQAGGEEADARQRPVLLNGYPSLVPGDYGANIVEDVVDSVRALRRRLFRRAPDSSHTPR